MGLSKERSELVSKLAESPSECLDAAMPDAPELTHAMVIAWLSQPRLQQVFDVSDVEGRRALRRWFRRGGDGGSLTKRAARRWSDVWARAAPGRGNDLDPGVNLVGYAEGVLGMGEHVRMSALAMQAAKVPSGIVNFTLGLGRRREAVELDLPVLRYPRHRCNLFHVNADQMPRTYSHLGGTFFKSRYNIGYWAWELARWPAQWVPTLGTVDEVWAPSRFVREAVAAATEKPVLWMPLCVELPSPKAMRRSEFGLSADDYVFVFTLDCHSYFERKNPAAVVRAFKTAFPREERARLIIKGMNAQICANDWRKLIEEAASDERILLIDRTWNRCRVIALLDCCDAYVSLHRSEGFGRGPAEAMLLGKPVIVTDYSGTTDFCRQDNALLVKYSLVAVETGSYVGAAGQVWADPSIEHAARHMRALFNDRTLGPRIGAKGRKTISEEFSASAIGRHYRARLSDLSVI
jgi:glycosyltransferase involved in cell wall biosynthesis